MPIIHRMFLPVLLLVVFSTSIHGQTQFFKSEHQFTEDELSNFYTSITRDEGSIYFIANDYKMYAYDKQSGKRKWVASISYKTTEQVFVDGNFIYAPYYKQDREYTARWHRETGILDETLPVGPMESQPVIRNGILYGTAVYDGGTIFAYDTKADSLLWWRFIAHGYSTQPVYFPDHIWANAEFENWATIDYKGRLTDTMCKDRADIFIADIPCIKQYSAITHDGLGLDNSFSKKAFGKQLAISPENTLRGQGHSFILYEDKLAVVGDRKKLSRLIKLPDLITDNEVDKESGLSRLIDADNETVSLAWKDIFIRYNFRKHKIEKQIDLSAWAPFQVLPDGEKIWLISKKDGLLYAISSVD